MVRGKCVLSAGYYKMDTIWIKGKNKNQCYRSQKAQCGQGAARAVRLYSYRQVYETETAGGQNKVFTLSSIILAPR